MEKEIKIKLELEARDVMLLSQYCDFIIGSDREILSQNIPDYVREQRLATMADAERIGKIIWDSYIPQLYQQLKEQGK